MSHRDRSPARAAKGRGSVLIGVPRLNFNKRWRKACRAAGFPTKLFHDFRRTAVRDLVRGGVHQSVAMDITGHKTASVFRPYNITSREDKIDALRRRQIYVDPHDSRANVLSLRRGPSASDAQLGAQTAISIVEPEVVVGYSSRIPSSHRAPLLEVAV